MYALKRILKSRALLVFLFMALTPLEEGLAHRVPDLREPAVLLRNLVFLAGIVYIVCYLFAPLVRRGRRADVTDERPWRFLLATGGATLVMWLSVLALLSVDLRLLSQYWASSPALEDTTRFEDAMWRLHVTWMTFTAIAAALYLFLVFPRRLARDGVKDEARP